MNRIFALSLVLTALPAQAQKADRSEHDAIKSVIAAETESFYKPDADAWQSTWLHEADVTRTMVNGNRYSSVIGWEQFGPAVVESIKKAPNSIPIKFTSDNFIIHMVRDMAWVEYDQTMTLPANPRFRRLSRESRALVKKDGGWKIIAQVTIDPETFGPNARNIEGRLNIDGYYLLTAGKVEEAIAVFSASVRLKPESWNAHDSLGEAYAAAGKKELAIEHYEKSLKLNPKSESGKKALAKLKGI